MVRVFKCHSFASQSVIPISEEPLTICAEDDKVFVATSECEIIVFKITNEASFETQRCSTISQVEKIEYNKYKNYVATIELKKSWKRITKSVRVYLNWEASTTDNARSRTKVRVAGKSHTQHVFSSLCSDFMEIIEVPLDENATALATCRHTGNFAIACGSEVKLCCIVEKTVANSDKTYLDVEVFLELCWNFPVMSISLCEEFVVCCSQKEVQGIRVRYEDRERRNQAKSTRPYMSETAFGFLEQRSEEAEQKSLDYKFTYHTDSDVYLSSKDYSNVGIRPVLQHSSSKTHSDSVGTAETTAVEDESFVEWDFVRQSNTSVYLPSLHTGLTQSHLFHLSHTASPPVLSDVSGGKVKATSDVQAETVLYLRDLQEKEEWRHIMLIPTYHPEYSRTLQRFNSGTDKMRSSSTEQRTSMCCYVSGSRGGYLYQISPHLTLVTSYKYTDKAVQVGVSASFLHVATHKGIETYTSRWAATALSEGSQDLYSYQIHPPTHMDICLCGHEPFLGVVSLSVGSGFLALMSKVEDPSSSEVHWGLYVLHSFSVADQYNDMMTFAEKIRVTGPSSYIHLLLEAHLLLSTNPMYRVATEPGLLECYRQVCHKIGEFYSQPGQEEWSLCWPYFHSSGASVQDIVDMAMKQIKQDDPSPEFGKGVLDCLDHMLFTPTKDVTVVTSTADSILSIYATSSPEKLAQLIMFSNLKSYSTETAFNHLSSWLTTKVRAAHPLSAVDRLALVHLHLARCEVEDACSELKAISKSSLVDICSTNPALIHENMSSFTPLAQLMRQHMSATLLEILVQMLDLEVLSLTALLNLLRNQSDLNNMHVREVLELILSDEKRAHLFEEAANLLTDIYLTRLKDKTQTSSKQITTVSHYKHSVSMPQGKGHFAPRFVWLDHLPPFQGPNKMDKPCQRLEVKLIPGQGSRNVQLPITMLSRQQTEWCQCILCNECLLKLQSLLCYSHLTPELASHVLQEVEALEKDNLALEEAQVKWWDSLRLLCLLTVDWQRAADEVVLNYPSVVGMFATSCLGGQKEKYAYLMHKLETQMKSINDSCPISEKVYVNAYKDLLTRMTEAFSTATFIELLPADGNLYFLLPFLCASLKFDQTEKLRLKIVDMGKDLLSHQ